MAPVILPVKEETRSVVKEEAKASCQARGENGRERGEGGDHGEKHSRYYQQSISNVIRRSLTRIVMLVNFSRIVEALERVPGSES